jgi:hypothetical protein
MTLVKSKINFLAWLKSAIYLSVVGGVILSSKSASAIGLNLSDTEELGRLSISRPSFPSLFSEEITGTNWVGKLTVIGNSGSNNDTLRVFGFLQHNPMPSHSHPNAGDLFVFSIFLDADNENNGFVSDSQSWPVEHTKNHSDLFKANLRIEVESSLTSVEDRIVGWTFNLEGKHRSEPVPEPTTIFGSALALSLGGWLKRKKSSQQNKTTP